MRLPLARRLLTETPLGAPLALTLAVGVAAAAGAALSTGPRAARLDDLHWTCAELAGALLALEGWRRRRGTAWERPAAWFLAAMVMFLVGQLVWDAEDLTGWLPFPSVSDVFYLAVGPCLLLGLRHLARQQLSAGDWHTARLDAASLTVASFTAAMAAFLPAQGGFNLFQVLVCGLYPLLWIAPASLGLVLVLTRRAWPAADSLGLHVATLFTALCWVAWNLAFLENRVVPGSALNLSFSAGAVAMGLGIRYIGLRRWDDERWDELCEGVLRLLPLMLVVLAAMGIVVANLPGTHPHVSLTAAFGGSAVVVLAALRQSLLLRERRRLLVAERLLRQRETELESRVQERTRELARATEAARAASLAKSQFLANISHEIRTPLNSVIGLSDVALADCPDPALRGYLERIQLSGRHLLHLIDDVLDMSRIEAGRVELEVLPFRMSQVFDSVRAAAGQAATVKGVSLSFTLDPRLDRPLRGDALRLGQVLINLVANAVKFTAVGRVDVEARVAEDGPDEVRVRVDVRDTGIGLAPEAAARVFSPFQQADNSTRRRFGGTGLGLAISAELVQLMGGEIGVESRPGEGSDFWFTARFGWGGEGVGSNGEPVRAPDRDPPADPPGDPPGDPARGPAEDRRAATDLAPVVPASPAPGALPPGTRVLLAEDNETNQLVATAMLRRLGLVPVVAGTGREVMRALEQDGPFDAVLMDVQMPDMDGLEVTRWIRGRAALARLPVIAMTANAMDQDRQRCLEAGMDDFIAKPVELERLRSTLARWVDGGRPPDTPPAP